MQFVDVRVLDFLRSFLEAYKDRTAAYRERTETQDETAQDLVEINRKLAEKALNV